MNARLLLRALACFGVVALASMASADTLVKMRYFPSGGEVRFGFITAPASITDAPPTPMGDPVLQEHRQQTQTFAIPDPTPQGGFTIPSSFPNPLPRIRTFVNNTIFGETSVRTFSDPKNAAFNFSTTAVSSVPLPPSIVGVMLVSVMGATGFPVPPTTVITELPTDNRQFGAGKGWGGQGAPLSYTATVYAPDAATHPTITLSSMGSPLDLAPRFTGTAMVAPGPNQFGGTMQRVGFLNAFLIIQSTTGGGGSGIFQTGTFPVQFHGNQITSMEGGGVSGPTWIDRATIIATLRVRNTPFSPGTTPNAPTTEFRDPLFFTAGDWGTGNVQVAALREDGTLLTQSVSGFDDRAVTGPSGTTRVLQLVRPLLEQQNLATPGVDGQAETGRMRITFMPEPRSMTMIAAGLGHEGDARAPQHDDDRCGLSGADWRASAPVAPKAIARGRGRRVQPL